jgi:hypothetical protein
MISRLMARLQRDSPARLTLQKAVDLFRQWPWIYPRGIEPSAQEWINRSQRSLGWYAGLRSDWHEEIYPGGISVHDHPEGLSDTARSFFNHVASRRYPDTSVCFFSGAHLFSNEGMVLTRDNRVLAEYYHQFGVKPLSKTIGTQPFGLLRSDVQRIDEAVGLLAAPQGWNYYHWLFDVLPRLHLLERWQGVIEKYAVPDNLSAVQLESLQLLGLESKHLLFLSAKKRLRCQHLYVPSLPGSEGCSPPWVQPFLQEKFLPAAAGVRGQGPLIYIVRGPSAKRPVLNESELIGRLERRGFRAVTPETLSFVEQVALFRDARVVVAAHGAGLANLAFASKIGILELFSADYARVDCYFTLARHAGFSYDSWLDVRKAGPDRPWGAITVDLAAIDQKVAGLQKALAG